MHSQRLPSQGWGPGSVTPLQPHQSPGLFSLHLWRHGTEKEDLQLEAKLELRVQWGLGLKQLPL